MASSSLQLSILPCHTTETTITIPCISAITTTKNITLILDIRASPGGGKHKNLNKKKLKKFFNGAAASAYTWVKTLSNTSGISKMTDEIFKSHLIRALGSGSQNVLVLLDRFDVMTRLFHLEQTDSTTAFSVLEFPDPSDIFSFSERPFDPLNTDVDPRAMQSNRGGRGRHGRPSADGKEDEDGKSEEPVYQTDPQLEEVPRFSLDENFSTDGLSYLEEHGYVVVRNVLSESEIGHAENLLWNHLEGLGSGIDRNDVQTWNNDNWPDRQRSGVVAWEGIGQSPFLWFVRGRANVRRVFEIALHSEILITSFDGCGLFRPWAFDASWKTMKSWLHVDQNPAFNPSFECLQGLVTLKDVTEETGGFTCIPRSQKEFLNFYERNRTGNKRMEKVFSRSDRNLVKLPQTDPLMNAKKIVPKLFAGDMILWDSRTMHCNTHALTDQVSDEVYNRGVNEWDLLRIVTYVCMSVPRMITEKGRDLETVIRQREHAVRNQVTTNHMPFIFSPNLQAPMRKGSKSKLRTPPWPNGFELSEEQWKLVNGM